VEKAMPDMKQQLEDLDDAEKAGVIEPSDTNTDAAGTAEPTHEGDPDEVGTPAWEAVDAAKARAMVAKLAWLKRQVGDLTARERQEAATPEHGGDIDHVIELEDVLAALDYAMGAMAHYAADEQSEADGLAEQIEEAAEAMGITKSTEPAPAPVTKADADPKALIRETMTTLAEAFKDDPAAAAFLAVAKDVPADPAPEAEPEGDAVPEDQAAPVQDAAPAPAMQAPAAPEAAPQPPAESTEDTVRKALDAQRAELEAVFKEQLRAAVAPLEERVQKMEAEPAAPKVMLNGQVPGADALVDRGQATTPDGLAAIHKALAEIDDPGRRAVAAGAAATAEVARILNGH
jgi:hypothetical protein